MILNLLASLYLLMNVLVVIYLIVEDIPHVQRPPMYNVLAIIIWLAGISLAIGTLVT